MSESVLIRTTDPPEDSRTLRFVDDRRRGEANQQLPRSESGIAAKRITPTCVEVTPCARRWPNVTRSTSSHSDRATGTIAVPGLRRFRVAAKLLRSISTLPDTVVRVAGHIRIVRNPPTLVMQPHDWKPASARIWLSALALVSMSPVVWAQEVRTVANQYPLTAADGLRPRNVTVTPVVYAGNRGVRLVVSDSAQRSVEGRPVDQQQIETFALVSGSAFTDGVIELEVAGAPAPGAPGSARGFVGLAFRVQSDLKTYDAFYLRPTNGRADEQVRRNHSAQYIAHPAWPWERLRRETPERYESYVDLVPGVWTRIRIEVRGTRARLFVHGQSQPTLIVDDVKSGATGSGAIALWIGPGTVAHFRDLRVRP